jgi:superfamily II DNA or RNA helicase
MLQLHAHNKTTYSNLTKLFREYKRVAVVQPTGTGKSFIVLRLIEDNANSKFLVISPSVYIFSQLQTHAENSGVDLSNVIFVTYSKLATLINEEISSFNCDYIILDEFHRCGAVEWGRGVNTLLEIKESAKVLGTSATPIRYLDSCRNMAEEIFHNVYAVNMSLAEAIRRKILPLPVYITSWYSFSGEIERLQMRVNNTKNPRLRLVLMGKIKQAKRMITKLDCGIEKIFKRHIPNPNGKYIVFCPGVERLRAVMGECDEWFSEVNTNIHKYSVYTGKSDSQSQFESFKNDNSDNTLKLLLCVDMLNEGVHIDGVEGVIMLRATQSANVFYQQLGRALTCGSDKIKHPVIFDIVNNFEVGDTAGIYSQIMEMNYETGRSESGDIEFELYDYVRDIRKILNELNSTFENSWELVFDALREFCEKNKRFPYTNESYDGMLLGRWCITQRQLYKNGRLTDEQVELLNSIGFVWDVNEEIWNGTLEQVKEFYALNKRFPIKSDIDESTKKLYAWLINQRIQYKRKTLSEDRAERLISIGFNLKTLSPADAWEVQFNRLAEFKEQNGRLPNYGDIANNDDMRNLYDWMSNQITRRKSGAMSEEQFKKLESIGFVWDKNSAQWDYRFEVLKKFIAENGRVPKNNEKYGGDAIGQWYIRQLRAYKDGSLDSNKIEKMNSLSISLTSSREVSVMNTWNTYFDALQRFMAQNNRLPYSREKFENMDLYKWLGKQKTAKKSGELLDEQLKLLVDLGIDVENFSVKKAEPTERWKNTYNTYKTFVEQNDRTPSHSVEGEKKLFSWAATQKQRYKTGNLSERQIEMLIDVGLVELPEL